MKLQHRRKVKRSSHLPLGHRRPPYGLVGVALILVAGLVFLYIKEVPAPKAPMEIALDAAKFMKE